MVNLIKYWYKMNFVLLHIGSTLPNHVKFCIKQIQKTNPDSQIYLITNLNIQDEPNVKIVNSATLDVPNIGNYYINDTFADLWRTAALRLFYIESLLKKEKLENVIHFDNDVLIYKNMDDILPAFRKFNFLMTPHFETEYVFGFSYIKNADSLTLVNRELLSLLLKGEHELRNIVMSMPHEMRLLNYINTTNNLTLIDLLPVLPYGVGSNNFDTFKVCFDPSSYGKHLGGSHEHTPAHKYYVPTKEWTGTEKHHYVGRAIINDNLKVAFTSNKPSVILNNNLYELVNLHIHSKDLKKWM